MGLPTNKRFLKFSAAFVFVCVVAFYVFPIAPDFITGKRHKHIIRPSDIELEASAYKISPSERASVCHAHNLPPYERDIVDPRRKVYDLFMINSELDWLEIRLHELAHQVDYFVILEAEKTFTGLKKKMWFQEHMHEFKEFEDKIIYHVLEEPEPGHPGHTNATYEPGTPEYEEHAWIMERFQRNAMFSQVLPFLPDGQAPRENDVIIVSDIDEIPRPATIQLLRECHFGRMTTLRSKFYYYGFQWLHRGQEWAHPQATTYHGPALTIPPHELRSLKPVSIRVPKSEITDLWNAGWHCSSCFSTIEEMLLKMKSFSHTNLNAEKFRNKERIVDRVRRGKDLWDRWFQWYVRVNRNEDVPLYVKENESKFGYMIDRDGENAGFVDYTPGEL